jgi:hypothetical protein
VLANVPRTRRPPGGAASLLAGGSTEMVVTVPFLGLLGGIGAAEARVVVGRDLHFYRDMRWIERTNGYDDANERPAAVREAEADSHGRGRLRLADDDRGVHAPRFPPRADGRRRVFSRASVALGRPRSTPGSARTSCQRQPAALRWTRLASVL